MALDIKIEFELNRAWIYDSSSDEPIGERNFVVSKDYFLSIFSKLFPYEKDINLFLDSYEPETDGEKIYQQAKKDNQIIDEFESNIEL